MLDFAIGLAVLGLAAHGATAYTAAMASSSGHIRDGSDEDFDRIVIERSKHVPVVVDFWAPWCGPCLVLAPVLEALAEEWAGGFELVKINSDENAAVSSRYRVGGIPHVLLFKDGEPRDHFVGALPEANVRAFLRKHCPTAADQCVIDGQRLLITGDHEGARQAFEQALALDGTCTAAQLGLARLALSMGDLASASSYAAAVPALADERESADYIAKMVAMLESVVDEGDATAIAARLERDPRDIAALYVHGVRLAAAGRVREGLDALFATVELDRTWHDQAARKAMLTVFGLIGVRAPLSDEFRRKLMFVY